jgi:hypothetical protein
MIEKLLMVALLTQWWACWRPSYADMPKVVQTYSLIDALVPVCCQSRPYVRALCTMLGVHSF